MKLKELVAASGLAGYGAVAMAIKRSAGKVARGAGEAAYLRKMEQMLNVKM